MLAHQPRHPIPAYPHTLDAQRPLDPWTAIRFMALRVSAFDALQQPLILLAAGARAAMAPGVVAAASHRVQSAHYRDRVLRPVCFDELEDFGLRSEANRMAFFRISCSS
jgi:hypothetical protein